MDPFNDDDSILSEALSQYEDTDDVDDLQLTQMCEETEFNHDLATPHDEILSEACLQMCEETEFNHYLRLTFRNSCDLECVVFVKLMFILFPGY